MMCKQCWIEHGSPTNVSPEIENAATLIDKIYETEVSGLPLHTALDDWNIEGEWEPWPDHQEIVARQAWTAAVELCKIMNELPVEDRASALALSSGFFEP